MACPVCIHQAHLHERTRLAKGRHYLVTTVTTTDRFAAGIPATWVYVLEASQICDGHFKD